MQRNNVPLHTHWRLRQLLYPKTVKAIATHPEHKAGIETTYSDADFAKDLLWDLSCLFQRLVQGATILQPAGKENIESLKIERENQHTQTGFVCVNKSEVVHRGKHLQYNL